MKLVSGEIESFMNFTKSFVDFMDEEEALKLNEYDNQFILTEYTKYIKKILNKKPENLLQKLFMKREPNKIALYHWKTPKDVRNDKLTCFFDLLFAKNDLKRHYNNSIETLSDSAKEEFDKTKILYDVSALEIYLIDENETYDLDNSSTFISISQNAESLQLIETIGFPLAINNKNYFEDIFTNEQNPNFVGRNEEEEFTQ